MQDHIYTTLFELLRISVGQQRELSIIPTKREWQTIFDVAKKHALVGACLAALEKLTMFRQNLSEDLLLQWIAIGRQIELRNKTVNGQCLQLIESLQKEGLRGCILKGQGNAAMYGWINPQLALWRQTGDIDVWIEGGFEKVMCYVNKISPTNEVNRQHVQFHVFKDTAVELHFTPSRLANRWVDKRIQSWFELESNRQMSHKIAFERSEISIPTTDFNIVYQMLHVYKHLFNDGIGLRQLMDYYILLMTSSLSEVEKDNVIKLVRRFGMQSFAEALTWVLSIVFHLDQSKIMWKPDEKKGKFLLSEVMQMGNFGHSDNRYVLNNNDSHYIRYLLRVKSKMRFVKYFPCEALWQPVDIFFSFFELRVIRWKAKRLAPMTTTQNNTNI